MKTSKMECWVLNFCKENGWANNPSKDLNKLVEELGELSREMSRFDEGRQRPDESDDLDKSLIINEISSEIGDIMFPLIKLINYYGLTLEKCFENHKEKMEKRYKGEVL